MYTKNQIMSVIQHVLACGNDRAFAQALDWAASAADLNSRYTFSKPTQDEVELVLVAGCSPDLVAALSHMTVDVWLKEPV